MLEDNSYRVTGYAIVKKEENKIKKGQDGLLFDLRRPKSTEQRIWMLRLYEVLGGGGQPPAPS